MPGDLRDPDQSIPFYYDPRYDTALSVFTPGSFDTNGYLQSIAIEAIGSHLSPQKLEDIKNNLEQRGFFHRNVGDESFRNEAIKVIKNMTLARKVAWAYARSK